MGPLANRRVLVTDEEMRHSLPVVRSLARAGATVIALSHSENALAFASRAVAVRLLSPAATDPVFARFIEDLVRTSPFDILMPVGLDSHRALAVSNLSDLDPPRAIYIATFSHPTPPERIRAGRRWAETEGRSPRAS